MPEFFWSPTLFFSPQEDDFWKSQWLGAVHQRIWTRAWCQKIKRFALLFLFISVNICRAALFPAGVKTGKVFDSFRICFKPNKDAVGSWPVLRQNPSLAQFPIQILLFWSSWTLGSMSSLWELELSMEPGRDGSVSSWADDQTFKALVLRCKRTAALHMLPTQAGTCCWCCFSALGKAQCPNGSRQSLVFPATAPCPECQQSKPFRRVTGISFVPHFADIPCLLFFSQPGSMFSQAMKKWVQGNTDEVCPLSCSSCDFTLQRNKALIFLILVVISEYLFAAPRTGRHCVLNIIWLHVCVKLVCSLPVLAGWTN